MTFYAGISSGVDCYNYDSNYYANLVEKVDENNYKSVGGDLSKFYFGISPFIKIN